MAWNNPAASNAAGAASRAPRVECVAGNCELREHGNSRRVTGKDLTDAQAYVDLFWSKYPTGYINPEDKTATEAAADGKPQIVVINGKTYLLENGNTRLLQPSEVAAATNYVNSLGGRTPSNTGSGGNGNDSGNLDAPTAQ